MLQAHLSQGCKSNAVMIGGEGDKSPCLNRGWGRAVRGRVRVEQGALEWGLGLGNGTGGRGNSRSHRGCCMSAFSTHPSWFHLRVPRAL